MAADFEIKIPIKPVWTAEAQRFVDRVKKEMGTVGASRGGGTGGGALFGGGGGKGLGAILGIGSVLAVVVAILSQFKSMTNIAKTIIKVMIEFLRPIADVVTLMLLPILAIMKPIMIIIRQVMAPFRKAALKLSAEGAKALREGDTGRAAALFGLSIQTGLAGLGAVITVLFKDIINLSIVSIGEFAKIIIQAIFTALAFISPFGSEAILKAGQSIIDGIDIMTGQITNVIDATVAIMITGQVKVIESIAKAFGVDMGTFGEDVKKMIEQVIVGENNSIWKEFQSGLAIIQNDIPGRVDDAFDPIIRSIESSLDRIRALVSEASSQVSAARSLYSRIDETFFQGRLPFGAPRT